MLDSMNKTFGNMQILHIKKSPEELQPFTDDIVMIICMGGTCIKLLR